MSDRGDLQEELASFRQDWKHEIQRGSNNNSARNSPAELNQRLSSNESAGPTVDKGSLRLEQRASKLFQRGVLLERNGCPYEAIRFYRQAIQLVPDIEFKINSSEFTSVSDDEDDENNEDTDSEDETNFSELSSMVEKFHQLSVSGHTCVPEFQPRMTHISVIPVELLMHICKWVVSSDLDFKSLEQLAGVCRGFYACARDAEIWRLGCLRIWGLKCGLPLDWNGSWRQMYLERPHVLTQGVYISKTEYVRQGERSLDCFYQPYHLVEYYRYIRFCNNGRLLFLTTAEEPINIVPRLSQISNLSLLHGHYTVIGDKVLIVIDVPVDSQGRSKRGKKAGQSSVQENTFHMEFLVQGTKRKKHNQLVWSLYRHVRKHRDSGQTVESEIDLSRQFPSLYFSPVRSFVQTATAPLG